MTKKQIKEILPKSGESVLESLNTIVWIDFKPDILGDIMNAYESIKRSVT